MKKAGSVALAGALGLMVILATGCPPALFQVTYPVNSQNYTINASNQLVITVQFTEPVRMSSLLAGTSVILVTEKKPVAPITIAAGASADEIVITTVDAYGDLLTFDPDGFFSLTLKGTGDNRVRSRAGAVLDGDADGAAGGDFVFQFTLLG